MIGSPMDEAILAVGAPAPAAPCLQERAAAALEAARQEDQQRAWEHAKYEDERRRRDLVGILQRRLDVTLEPSQIERDPERQGAEAYTTVVDGLRFRASRRYGGYDADELQVALTCPKCGEPVWVEVASLAELGEHLERGAGHQVCPEEWRRQEQLEEEIAQLPPPRPRQPTPAEQLQQVIRSIAEDVYQAYREGV
jgi:hypothetical protein